MSAVKLRVVLVGCVASSEVALRTLLNLRPDGVELVGLVTRRASAFNSDFVDLAPLTDAAGVPLMAVDDGESQEQLKNWLTARVPDVTMVVGWSRLLGPQLLSIPSRGSIGYHPAALPANRGRHPIAWALALGLTETASTFFQMGEGADDGPILHQVPVPIAFQDDAQALYDKLLVVIPAQIRQVLNGLITGQSHPTPQDHSRANTWRKRSAADGCIDWRMGAVTIHNLVRALARPYPGAHFIHRSREVKVWKCWIEQVEAANSEPGKVLGVEGEQILVKAGEGAVRLLGIEINPMPQPGDYL